MRICGSPNGGIEIGCVGTERADVFARKKAALNSARDQLLEIDASPTALRAEGLEINQDGVRRNGMDLLAYPGIDMARLAMIWPDLLGQRADVVEQLEIEAAYANYLERQDADGQSHAAG